MPEPSNSSSHPVNHFLAMCLGFILAWFLWDWARYDLWMLKIFAVICALGGVIRFIKGLFALVGLLWKYSREASYRQKGSAPKADRMISADDLKKQRLIK